MQRKLAAVLFTAIAGLAVASQPASAVGAGAAAPDFQLQGASSTVSLANLRGKVVYVDFWASWCGPCRISFPWLNEMQKKYGAQGFEVVGINVDAKRADADKFLSQTPAAFTIAFDPKGETPGKYQAQGMPSSYLVGRDGRVISTHVGFRDSDKEKLEAKIKQALGAK